MRGPAPKPTALKVLSGNPGHRPLPKHEPRPRRGVPPCPDWLDAIAKAEWRRVAPELDRLGLLTHVDLAALASYCQAYGDLVAARRDIAEHGYFQIVGENHYEQQRPAVALSQKSMQLIKAFCAEFGLTPSSRSRINLGPSDETTNDLLD